MSRPYTREMLGFDTLAALVEVVENLIPLNRILG